MLPDYLAVTKPRITALILVCTAVGYLLGSPNPDGSAILAYAIVGSALLASGTAALNQWYEADSDARMRRTRNRPMASGRMKRSHGLMFGLALAVAGFVSLWRGTNSLAAWSGLFTVLSYLLVYTPLKTRSPICTVIGAVPGAMPPVIGYAAAAGTIDWNALALFGILFVWQFPHFDAIAWMYREDYARGGVRMLPVIEPDGDSTARRILLSTILLVPVSLLPAFLGMTGAVYAFGAAGAGAALMHVGAQLNRERTSRRARALLLATIVYLPILLGAMLLDRRS